MGLWKFRSKVTLIELEQLAKQWASDPKYLQLYTRGGAKDQIVLGFIYQAESGTDDTTAYEEYFESTSDSLKRQFGNDLVGWDVSIITKVIKDQVVQEPAKATVTYHQI